MTQLSLSLEESQALSHLLDCGIKDLRTEIVHTDNWEFKADLKQRKELLISLRDRIDETVSE